MQIIITGVSRGLGYELFKFLLPLCSDKVEIIALSRTFSSKHIGIQNKNLKMIEIDFNDILGLNNLLLNLTLQEKIIFINNASIITPITKIQEISNEQIINAINTNLVSTMLITKKIAEKKAYILNISSGAANRAIDMWSLYCSSKAGAKMFFDVISKQENINVKHIDPGVMDTRIQDEIREANFDIVDVFKQYKNKRLLQSPKEVAKELYNKHLKEQINEWKK